MNGACPAPSRYIRLSVTDRCDFRCVYCMTEEMTFLPRAQVLSLEELYLVGKAFVDLDNHTSNKRLGLSKSDAYSLYLAYYSGHGGYARGTWKRSSAIKGYAKKAARQAAIYKRQLRRCKI